MAIEIPAGDLSRTKSQEMDQSWPSRVELVVVWETELGPVSRAETITADQFFGRGDSGAPLSGDSLISSIERMRRMGPPEVRNSKARRGK